MARLSKQDKAFVSSQVSSAFDDLHDRLKHDHDIPDEAWLAIYKGIAKQAREYAAPLAARLKARGNPDEEETHSLLEGGAWVRERHPDKEDRQIEIIDTWMVENDFVIDPLASFSERKKEGTVGPGQYYADMKQFLAYWRDELRYWFDDEESPLDLYEGLDKQIAKSIKALGGTPRRLPPFMDYPEREEGPPLRANPSPDLRDMGEKVQDVFPNAVVIHSGGGPVGIRIPWDENFLLITPSRDDRTWELGYYAESQEDSPLYFVDGVTSGRVVKLADRWTDGDFKASERA
jgi:hypothetical protein